ACDQAPTPARVHDEWGLQCAFSSLVAAKAHAAKSALIPVEGGHSVSLTDRGAGGPSVVQENLIERRAMHQKRVVALARSGVEVDVLQGRLFAPESTRAALVHVGPVEGVGHAQVLHDGPH